MNLHVVSAADAAREVRGAPVIGVDVETTGLDPYANHLRLVQLAVGGDVFVVDALDGPLDELREVMGGSESLVVGHNLRFDLGFLWANGFTMPARVFDTQLASQLIDGGVHLHDQIPDPTGRVKRGRPVKLRYHSLAALVHRELGQTLDKQHQLTFVENPNAPLTPDVLDYAVEDAAVLLPLVPILAEKITAYGLDTVADIEFRALLAFLWLDMSGMPFDVPCWTDLRDAARRALDDVEREIEALVPGLNTNSWQQKLRALEGHGVRVPNVQEATLKQVKGQHELVELFLRQADLHKKADTYGDGYLNLVNPVTGRIHADIKQIGADTGRTASGRPNLQNIPRDPQYRACFAPGSGRVLIKADYSQIELRIGALIAGDKRMLQAFDEGEDVHTLTAAALVGREPTKADRQIAKAVNFGLLYGMGAPKLQLYARDSYGVEMSLDEAFRFRETYFALYPGLRAWHQRQPRGVRTVRTLSGRPRFRVERFTDGVNTPVQGTGADAIKLALAYLWERRMEVPADVVPVMTVHDEIVVESSREHAERAADWVTKAMLDAADFLFPGVRTEVEAKIARDWSGAE